MARMALLLCLILTVACGDVEENNMPGHLLPYGGISGGWAQTGKLITGNSDSSVGLATDFPISQVYTIQFGVLIAEGISFDAVADITWTTEGNKVTRRVSVGNGVSVSAPAQGVNVRVFDRSVNGSGDEYQVTIKVTPGVRPNVLQPPTLLAVTNTGTTNFVVAAGGFVDVDIPSNAGAISVNISAAPNGVLALASADALAQQGTGLSVLKQYSPIDMSSEWVPIVPNATFIRLTNQLPALGPSIIFVVTFGIDG